MSEPATPLTPAGEPGWRRAGRKPSLAEVYRTIPVPREYGFFRKMLAFSGPGYLVAVGYMDPGNWATDLAAGSAFGYQLLSVILLANLMAVLLQSLSAKLGIVTGRDLAQACRDHYSHRVAVGLWLLCELAICACDLAEVIGSAVALNLLFGLPLVWGTAVTGLDVLLILLLHKKGFRFLEALVLALIVVIGGCFALEIIFAHPEWAKVLRGCVPSVELVKNPAMLYLAVGILGATVMPHNLYLHSSVVQTRKYEQDAAGKAEAIKYATLDAVVALTSALVINGAILMVAATFHRTGQHQVAEIQEAYKLLSPTLGVAAASTVFALALLASGQNSTLTGTLAGQIVMEGFLNLRLRPWLRRVLTRGLALGPAMLCAALYGASGTAKLLVLSQVTLSLQLPFALIPLVRFTSDRRKMGQFANRLWVKGLAWVTAGLILALNLKLVLDFAGVSAKIARLFG